ncbi:hypothetical protein KGO95_02745 [Patescibacteria group bacterium]|nr:hypothetical protein [Patescibacteria group bacterium]
MKAIQWWGNSGYLFPDPGTIRKAYCGVCDTRMTVRRSVLGPTCFAMAMAGHKRRHDSFYCPNYGKDWHHRIDHLKMEVNREELNHGKTAKLKRIRRNAKKEILKLLKKHMAR